MSLDGGSTASGLGKYPVATLQHCVGGDGLLDTGFSLLWRRHEDSPVSVVGRIRTVLTGPGDNLAIHRALADLCPGDFIVAQAPDGGRGAALWGEVISEVAAVRGAVGAVIDGGIRDTRGILDLGFPVWFRRLQPATASKNEPGELDTPLAVGGQLLRSGQLLAGDEDGLLRLAVTAAAELAELAEEHSRQDNAIRDHLVAGGSYADF